MHVGEGVTFWPRVGVSYVNVSGRNDSSFVAAVSLEAQFVATLARHVGLTFTPVADVGVAATGDKTLSEYGIEAGLLAWF
jgi:hypothetical protein